MLLFLSWHPPPIWIFWAICPPSLIPKNLERYLCGAHNHDIFPYAKPSCVGDVVNLGTSVSPVVTNQSFSVRDAGSVVSWAAIVFVSMHDGSSTRRRYWRRDHASEYTCAESRSVLRLFAKQSHVSRSKIQREVRRLEDIQARIIFVNLIFCVICFKELRFNV